VRLRFFYLLFILLPIASFGAGSSLEQANKLYEDGQFEKARQVYEEARQQAELPNGYFYNLGTVALKAGAAGEAYVALRRAMRAKPFDRDIRANLELAHAKISPSAAAIRPANWISWWPESLQWIRWQAWACAGLIFLIPFLWGAKNNPVPWQWGMLVLALSFGAAAALAFRQHHPGAAGIIQPTKVFSGPGSTYPEITSLEAGSLVSLEESRDKWVKIRYLDSRLQETVGWVESATALKLEGGS
jgi:hypothetical protein